MLAMYRALTIVSWFLGICLWSSASLAAHITGHVVITKNLTKERVTLPSYQLRTTALPSQQQKPATINEFSRLAIYLEGPQLERGIPVRVELDQKNARFEPEILVIPVGSTVSFPNSDPVFHNVFSLSKAKMFDLGYYPAGQSRTVKFERAGVVQVYCHLHAQMNAAILVVPSAWQTKPQKDGSFSLSDIPAGTQTLVAWHKSAGFFKRKVELSENGSVEIDLTIPIRESE
jgi:plastocyanin